MVRPSIKRHNTAIRLTDSLNTSQTAQSRRRIHSTMDGPSKGGSTTPGEGKDGDSFEVSVETDSCVSTLELVQLPMDKLGK